MKMINESALKDRIPGIIVGLTSIIADLKSKEELSTSRPQRIFLSINATAGVFMRTQKGDSEG